MFNTSPAGTLRNIKTQIRVIRHKFVVLEVFITGTRLGCTIKFMTRLNRFYVALGLFRINNLPAFYLERFYVALGLFRINNLPAFYLECRSLTHFSEWLSCVRLLTKGWPLLGVFEVSVKRIQINF